MKYNVILYFLASTFIIVLTLKIHYLPKIVTYVQVLYTIKTMILFVNR